MVSLCVHAIPVVTSWDNNIICEAVAVFGQIAGQRTVDIGYAEHTDWYRSP